MEQMIKDIALEIFTRFRSWWDIPFVLITVVLAFGLRRIINGSSSLTGDRDLAFPFGLSVLMGLFIEWTTDAFNPKMAMYRVSANAALAMFLYRPKVFLVLLPDSVLAYWPATLGGDIIRAEADLRRTPGPSA